METQKSKIHFSAHRYPMPRKKQIINHTTACKIAGCSHSKMHRLCEAGCGPKREWIDQTKTWSYDRKSIEKYVVVNLCQICGKPISVKKFICDNPDCIEARSKRQLFRKPRKKHIVPSWEVVCPVCRIKHHIKADIQPNKWVYCPEHSNRRYARLSEEDNCKCIAL